MKLDVEDILDRVSQTERDRAGYAALAEEWERAWCLKAFDRSQRQAIEQDGQEQVTLPLPFNIVNLAQRLISTIPKIDVPSPATTKEADDTSEKCERWLNAFWQQANKAQNRNIISDATWQAFVRGRFCFEVKWIYNELPERLRKRRLPFLIRTLDPLNVGVKAGPLYTQWAYHEYREDKLNVRQRYPKIKLKETRRGRDDETEIEVIDYWYTSPEDGSIWNAVIVDEQFAKKPTKTDYPDIPFIESYGDTAPLATEDYKGLSLLHPLTTTGLWKYQCRLASQMGTGLLWYFWPAITVQNEFGAPVEDIEIRPGKTHAVPWGTKVDMIQMSPNVPLAQAMDARVSAEVQNSTFPEVMYGKAPGDLQAGYGVSLLSDAAKGRIRATLENLEYGLVRVHELVLGLIEALAPDEGVDVWGYDERDAAPYRLTLTPKEVRGYRDTVVSLKPQVPQDMMQRQTLGLRLIEAGVLSRRSYRDKYMDMPVPSDEQARVELEMALISDQMKPIVQEAALRKYFGPDWRDALGLPPPQPPTPPMPPGMEGMPPAPMPIQPEGMGTPMGGGIPPEIAGQMTPELMGLPPGVDPLMFAQMMGQPLPPGEELNVLQGLPPGGIA